MATRGKGEFGYGALETTSESQPHEGQSKQFADLSQQISTAIFKIGKNVTTLEKAVRQIGTPSDSTHLRNRIQASIQTTNTIIHETTIYLKDLTLMSQNLGKSSRLQVDRLTNEYHDTVQRYSGVQKKVASKMRSCPNIPPKAPPTSGGMDVVQYDDESRTALLAETRRHDVEAQMQVQDQQIEQDMNLLQQREEQIRQIEAAMLDVNEIFRDLSAMVSEQGEAVDSIEANIDKASSNVESAKEQLQTASKYQQKARRKMCCVLVCVLVLLAILGLILGLTLR